MPREQIFNFTISSRAIDLSLNLQYLSDLGSLPAFLKDTISSLPDTILEIQTKFPINFLFQRERRDTFPNQTPPLSPHGPPHGNLTPSTDERKFSTFLSPSSATPDSNLPTTPLVIESNVIESPSQTNIEELYISEEPSMEDASHFPPIILTLPQPTILPVPSPPNVAPIIRNSHGPLGMLSSSPLTAQALNQTAANEKQSSNSIDIEGKQPNLSTSPQQPFPIALVGSTPSSENLSSETRSPSSVSLFAFYPPLPSYEDEKEGVNSPSLITSIDDANLSSSSLLGIILL